MKIAIMATNLLPTPPVKEKTIYAPLWITKHLAEGLQKKGHEVTLFGSKDSSVKTKVSSMNLSSLPKQKEWGKVWKALNRMSKTGDIHNLTWAVKWKEVLRENYELFLASTLFQRAKEFDIIQFHSPVRLLHFAPFVKTPLVVTIHDTFPHPNGTNAVKLTYKYLDKYYNLNFVSVSHNQRKPLPKINYKATIYHGIELDKFPYQEKQGDYLAFAGRIVEQKGIDVAIKVAQKTKMKLKIAGSIPAGSEDYWNKFIKPHLSTKITYEGLLKPKQMSRFYSKAKALLMPINREESFGLVMAEAMACGTPVVAFNKGSVPEVVKHKKTGFVVKTEKEMIEAVKKIDTIKRIDCRKHVEDNFSLQSMIDNYEKLYQEIIKNK